MPDDGDQSTAQWADIDEDGLLESDFDGVDISETRTDRLHTPSRTASVIVWKDADGTVYADGPGGWSVPAGTDDVRVAQDAYDAAFGDTVGGYFVFAPGTWEFDDAFTHYQSGVTVSAPGAVIRPAGSYSGYLLEWRTTDDTITGDPGDIHDSYLRNVRIDGENQAKGVRMEVVLTSEMGPNVYLYDTDGAALRLANTIRHCTFWGPRIRYGGNASQAALEIGPREDATCLGDSLNNNYFYGVTNVYPYNETITIFGDSSIEGTDRCRGFEFYSGQLHVNTSENYGRHKGQTANVLLEGPKNVVFQNVSFRHAGDGSACVRLTSGPNDDPSENITFDNCKFHTNGSGLTGFQVEDMAGFLKVHGCNIGVSPSIDRIAEWSASPTGWELNWSGNDIDWNDDEPFYGEPPTFVNTTPDDRSFTGWHETWDDGRRRMRKSGASLVLGRETSTTSPCRKKYLPSVPRYENAGGDPTYNRGELLLASGDGVWAYINQLFNTMSWDVAFTPTDVPSDGSVRFWPLYEPHSGAGWRVDVRHDGSYTLTYVDVDGNGDEALSDSVSAPEGETHNLQVRRETDGTWTLGYDGVDIDSVSDGRVPPFDRRFKLYNAFDVGVSIGDMIAY